MSCEKGEFPCTQCGLCCQRVSVAKATQFLDRGDGICKHYDDGLRQCRIYENRPDICRVDRQFALHYHRLMSWSEFVNLNHAVCLQLQREAKLLE